MLETEFCGLKLKNPTVLASGILGTNAALLKRVVREGAGAVTMKSIGPREKLGHPNPTVIEWEHGLINAVGLPSPGYQNIESEFAELKNCSAPIIASIYGASVEEFETVAEAVAEYKPAIIEINISCPNTKKEGQIFGMSPEMATDVVSAVVAKTGKIPVMPKLTPQAPKIADIAVACEKAGANAICAVNTLGPGMLIDIEARKPILANKFGGVSGPAIKPIAVRCVYQIYRAVSIPILGMGGINSGKDAVEMMMAGASAVGIGTATHYRGIEAFKLIADEIKQWMKEHEVKSVKDLVGAAHD
ncbi:MAG: dihydroorotate dehydrogenase B catalytic subunit [Candidatus Diapherotrites archaeon]|uniref:Dihydroorotate dehydrogenase n=1 Tax=Candidatus Iainarchaeum sp. TaxID=3101447 RepID=A0A2D6M117_9ARCH|nr:dihydroorotate dehydrogenase B catalytic subunit [Candidatus Diapherotrites archaeon]